MTVGHGLTDGFCWALLAGAMVVAAALILYLNRGTVFYADELVWLHDTPRSDLLGLFEPHGGHAIATTRIAYKAILGTVGAEYIAFRVLGVLTLLLCAGFFYALAKRRIGALPALAPTLGLLFLGSAWQYIAVPVGISTLLSIAAGLAALLAFERGGRGSDAAACALLVLSVASFGTGLAFLVGVAAWVIVRDDRWRRAWVVLVPLALYGVWWLITNSSEDSTDQVVTASNVLLIPSYLADALAATLGAVAGLNYDFGTAGGEKPNVVPIGWGRVLAVIAVIALAVRLTKGRLPASF